jgi:hypothetical protein
MCGLLSAAVSAAQIRQLLFPGVPNQKHDKGELEMERSFKVRPSPPSHKSLLHISL